MLCISCYRAIVITKRFLILMKIRKLIYVVLMMVMVGCTPPDPLLEGEGPAHEALEGIDSLMWKQADSALKVMIAAV